MYKILIINRKSVLNFVKITFARQRKGWARN